MKTGKAASKRELDQIEALRIVLLAERRHDFRPVDIVMALALISVSVLLCTGLWLMGL